MTAVRSAPQPSTNVTTATRPIATPLDARWRALLDAIADGVTVQDARGALVFANATAARLMGFASAEEVLAATAADFEARFRLFDVADRPLSFDDLPGRRVLAGEPAPELLVCFRTRDAEARYAWVAARALHVGDGDARGGEVFAVNTFREATDVIAVQRAAHERVELLARERDARERADAAQRRTRDVLMQAPTAVAVVGAPDDVIELANPALCALVGRAADELVGRRFLDVFPEAAGQSISDALVRVRESGERFVATEMRVDLDRGDGVVAGWFDVSLSAVREGEAIVGVLVMASEVTPHVCARLEIETVAEALHRSERRYRTVVDATSHLVWSTTAEGMVVEPSASWAAFTGQTFQASRGYGWLDAIHPDDRARVDAIGRGALEARARYEFEVRVRRAGGEYAHVAMRGAPVVAPDGSIEQWVGLGVDVTDRVRAEEARRALAATEAARVEAEEARARTQRMLEGIADSFVVCDRDLVIRFVNEAAVRPIGKRTDEVLGRHVLDVVPEARGTVFEASLRRVIEEQAPCTVEEYFAPLDRWFESIHHPLGELGVAAYTRDVTAKKREEALHARVATHNLVRAEVGAALAKHRELAPSLRACCEALVTHLGVACARVWIADERAEVLELAARAGTCSVDAAHARIGVGEGRFGAIAEDRAPVLSHDMQERGAAVDVDWARREGVVAMAGHPLVVGEKLVGVLAVFAREPMHESVLAALGAVGDAIAQGIERHRAERDLEERAGDLSRSNAELEQFAYVASHDLQEPLRMIASYNQLLARRYKGKLDADADEFIAFSVDGVKRMQRLIQDLLAYSRVGRRAIELADVELERTLATVLAGLGGAIADASAIVTHDPLPRVLGDDGQLAQLLQNLVSNAIKFRGDAPPRVHVSARREGEEWIVSVADQGIGIEPQYFERIFVIFQRLHPRDRYPGTGIGLAICRKIVERHGGRIWVESQLGRGSVVSFSLPIAPRARGSSS